MPRPSKPMKKENRRRKKGRKDEGAVYGEYHDWIATHPCILRALHSCEGVVVGHHLKSVGSGGEDAGNEVPMCEAAHTKGPHAIHGPNSGPRTFEKYWGVDLEALAKKYHMKWSDEWI